MGTIRTKILFIAASLFVVAGSVNAYAQEAGSAKTEAAAPSQAPSQSEDDAVIRMRGLEERVNSLKEKIFRSKARLMLLRETVLNGALAGAKAKIVHRNNMVYRGSGYGVFSYVKGYSFKIRSSYAFTAEEGKVTSVRIVGYEKGGITTDLKDRPAVRYDVEVKRDPNQPNASGASQKSE